MLETSTKGRTRKLAKITEDTIPPIDQLIMQTETKSTVRTTGTDTSSVSSTDSSTSASETPSTEADSETDQPVGYAETEALSEYVIETTDYSGLSTTDSAAEEQASTASELTVIATSTTSMDADMSQTVMVLAPTPNSAGEQSTDLSRMESSTDSGIGQSIVATRSTELTSDSDGSTGTSQRLDVSSEAQSVQISSERTVGVTDEALTQSTNDQSREWSTSQIELKLKGELISNTVSTGAADAAITIDATKRLDNSTSTMQTTIGSIFWVSNAATDMMVSNYGTTAAVAQSPMGLESTGEDGTSTSGKTLVGNHGSSSATDDSDEATTGKAGSNVSAGPNDKATDPPKEGSTRATNQIAENDVTSDRETQVVTDGSNLTNGITLSQAHAPAHTSDNPLHGSISSSSELPEGSHVSNAADMNEAPLKTDQDRSTGSTITSINTPAGEENDQSKSTKITSGVGKESNYGESTQATEKSLASETTSAGIKAGPLATGASIGQSQDVSPSMTNIGSDGSIGSESKSTVSNGQNGQDNQNGTDRDSPNGSQNSSLINSANEITSGPEDTSKTLAAVTNGPVNSSGAVGQSDGTATPLTDPTGSSTPLINHDDKNTPKNNPSGSESPIISPDQDPIGSNPDGSRSLVTSSASFEQPGQTFDSNQSTEKQLQLPIRSSDGIGSPIPGRDASKSSEATTPFHRKADSNIPSSLPQASLIGSPLPESGSSSALPSANDLSANGPLAPEDDSPRNPSDNGLPIGSRSPSSNVDARPDSNGSPNTAVRPGSSGSADSQRPTDPSSSPRENSVNQQPLDSSNKSATGPSGDASPTDPASKPTGPIMEPSQSNSNANGIPSPTNLNDNANPNQSEPASNDESPLTAAADRSPSEQPIAGLAPSGTPSVNLSPSSQSANVDAPAGPTVKSSSASLALSDPVIPLPSTSSMSMPNPDSSQSVDSNAISSLVVQTPNDTIDPSLMELLNKINFPARSTDSIAQTTSLKAALPFLTSSLSLEIQKQIGIQWSMTFVKCYYSRADCLVETDFRWDLTAVFGSCFTFNFNDSAVRMFEHPGPQYGLSLTLYTYQEDFICTTDSTGFKISLQLPTEAPFPETSGIYAMPGVVTSTIVSRVTNLKRDDCIQNGDRSQYYYDGTYTVEGCMRSCHQKYAMQQCGCADPRYPKPEGERFCDLDDMMCLENFLACSQDLLTTDQCSCKPVCRETQYTAIVTTSAINFDTDAWIPVCGKYIGTAWNGSCQEYLQRSIAVLNIYFDRLSEVVNTEEDAYPNLNYLSDLFAWMGLSFGICFGTVVEIGFIVVDVITAIVTKVFKCCRVQLLDKVEPLEGSIFD